MSIDSNISISFTSRDLIERLDLGKESVSAFEESVSSKSLPMMDTRINRQCKMSYVTLLRVKHHPKVIVLCARVCARVVYSFLRLYL